MQKEGKEKGKKSKMVPLITVAEGVEEESKGRNRTKEAVHFVDEKFSTKELWKSVEGYIGASYELDISGEYICARRWRTMDKEWT